LLLAAKDSDNAGCHAAVRRQVRMTSQVVFTIGIFGLERKHASAKKWCQKKWCQGRFSTGDCGVSETRRPPRISSLTPLHHIDLASKLESFAGSPARSLAYAGAKKMV
jgi:hypothetical protein